MVGLGITIIWSIFGFVVLAKENRIGAITTLVFSITSPAYVGYMFYSTYSRFNSIDADDMSETRLIVAGIYIFGIFAILTRVFLVGLYFYCLKNFGNGLRERLVEGKRLRKLASSKTVNSTRRSEIEIDVGAEMSAREGRSNPAFAAEESGFSSRATVSA